jgi:nucleotide-binding universal stress UspA family protein
MGLILYPTRGGESSHTNQDRGIQIAKEQDAELLFLFVTNVHFLDMMASPVLMDVEDEIDEMGEFLMAMASERAEKEGVQASPLVRRGEFLDVVCEVIQEFKIDALILGRPIERTALTSHDYIVNLAQKLAEEEGIDTYVVDQGEVTDHFS